MRELNPDLIKKLSTGEHVIGIASSSGTASAHFTVKEPETESIKESETGTISQIESETTSQYTFDENETNASSINTGDRNHGKLWLVIAIIYVVSKRK